MADLVVTSANVTPYEGAKLNTRLKAGETITAGQLVYLEAATRKWKKIDSDSATAEARVPSGMAMCSGSLDQPIVVCEEGDVNPGATVAVGGVYVASDTAGGIMPAADLEAGDYVTFVGLGITTSKLRLKFVSSGVAVP